MAKLTDPDYLARQYGDARNLTARLRLHQRYSTNRYGWQRWLFDRLALPAAARILDVGCGSGELWRENLARVPAGWRPTLADLSAGMLQATRRNLAAQVGRFPLANADAQNLPFPDDCFDGVLANHMLNHVPHRPSALQEIRRVLRPGGRLYASTVGEQHMLELSRSQLARRFGIELGTEPARGAAGGQASGPADFSLENGGDQLAYLFTDVRLSFYEDRLEVDNAAVIVDYVNSMEKLDQGVAARLLQALEQEIKTHGPLRIGKFSGVFEAVKQA
jgi:SAM-dependent methyltransferase